MAETPTLPRTRDAVSRIAGSPLIWRAIWLALAGAALAGCAAAPGPLSDSERSAVYQRADRQFASAILLKPSATLPADLPALRLAPLFLLEAVATDAAAALPQSPTVFFSEGREMLQGRLHDQVTYRWQPGILPPAPVDATPWQGIRITLNGAGQPVIWEVFRDSSGAALVFVAQSVEAAALREFGPPLPGRRFAIEGALAERPEAIVGRVIEDGPVAMGPIVHISAATGDVSTLICRCMAPQARQLTGQWEYELLPAEFGPAGRPEDSALTLPNLGLRLPAAF